jgi:hypothetical protein
MAETMRLVQYLRQDLSRGVALVDKERLLPVQGFDSIYRLAIWAIDNERSLRETVERHVSGDAVPYNDELTFLPVFDHPDERARCLVSGTGLTHRKSAQTRNSMHTGSEAMTDSMRMYEWGVQGGRPAADCIGAQPEWFYKGNGYILRGHNEELQAPAYGEDGGEEAEVAGCYIIDWSGAPRRVGFAMGNEFSDHVMERRNYLYLAPSKLRQCSLGPELLIDSSFDDIRGQGRIERAGEVIWTKDLATGESHMCHSLANLEHHHFKYSAHRQAGDAHVHFFGAGAFSFGEVTLQDGDIMEIAFEGFGHPLRNPIRVQKDAQPLVRAIAL